MILIRCDGLAQRFSTFRTLLHSQTNFSTAILVQIYIFMAIIEKLEPS